MKRALLLVGVNIAASSAAFSALPSWEPTYEMWRSTIFMPCNYSGVFDAQFAALWGIADFDWSNGKNLWVNSQPMDCQEMMVTQAQAVKDINPETRVFVYRNFVKALPWLSSVREKVTDPAYSGWFLGFKDGVKNGTDDDYSVDPCTGDKCSALYHDVLQTPGHPTGDGNCVEECDCGEGLPCGEYLFDHRNGSSLREWLVSEFVMGESAGVGNSAVDGVFLDDDWLNHTGGDAGYCNADPFGGPTEEASGCTQDMGLTQTDTTAITDGWAETVDAVREAVIAGNGFNYQMFEPFWGSIWPPEDSCASYLRDACSENSWQQTSALRYEVPSGSYQDYMLADFLLIRGPYAWIGYGWTGCSAGSAPANQTYMRPSAFDVDYGTPLGLCYETAQGSGVFVRSWTHATILTDCNSGERHIDYIQPDDDNDDDHSGTGDDGQDDGCDACQASAFPIDLNNTQCFGLSKQPSVTGADDCRDACCEDRGCSVWQWCSGGEGGTCNGPLCFIGQPDERGCDPTSANAQGWVGQGADTPPCS